MKKKTLRDRKGRSVRVDDRRKTKREDENNEKDFSARRGKTFKDGKSRRDWFKSERSEGPARPQRKPFRDSYKRSDDQEHRGFDKTSRGDKPFRKNLLLTNRAITMSVRLVNPEIAIQDLSAKHGEKRDRPERSQQKRSFSSRDRSTEDNNNLATEQTSAQRGLNAKPGSQESAQSANHGQSAITPSENLGKNVMDHHQKNLIQKKPDGFRKSEGDEKKPFRKSGFRDGAATFSKGPKREGFKRGGSSRNGEGRSGGPSKSRFGKAPPRKPR